MNFGIIHVFIAYDLVLCVYGIRALTRSYAMKTSIMPKFKTKKRNQKIHKIFNKKFKEKEPQTFNYIN